MNEHEREQNQTPAPAQTPQEEPAAPDRRETNRRNLVQGFAGAYLLYTAWQLISGLVSDWPQGAWSREQILAVAAGALFAVTGAGFLLLVLRRSLRAWKKERQKED